MINIYTLSLAVLIQLKRRLAIVVVGANDGRFNDPIYGFAMRMAARTRMLLIEPNRSLIPYLQANYQSHPDHRIANCAIGEEGTLTLYAVKPEWIDRYQPAYAQGWPHYRAATGITSANRDHVAEALLREGINPGDAIERLHAPCHQLSTVLASQGMDTQIDVLQIDAEGYDDAVIHASTISVTKPKLIYFENHNIPQPRMELLSSYLSSENYRLYALGRDSLAVSRRLHPLCLALHGAIAAAQIAARLVHG
jgi:FkbM family methyltransferase